MKVLVACEFSGVVRDAFLAEGHDAISCDILPTESPGPHIQGDARPLLREPWDLVVAFPPCSFLSMINCWLKNHERNPNYWQGYREGMDFFHACRNANAFRVAVENPTPAPWAKTEMGLPDDKVEPYQFGEMYRKRTFLWLKNLPPLMRTLIVSNPQIWVQTSHYGVKRDGKVRLREGVAVEKHESSRFWPGIARAMAQQWGSLLPPR